MANIQKFVHQTHVQNGVILQKVTVDRVIKKLSYHLKNPKIHYYVNKTQPLDPILSRQIKSISSNTISLRYIPILSTHPCLGLPNCFFLSSLPTKIMYAFLISLMCNSCPIHLLHFITDIIFEVVRLVSMKFLATF